MPAMTPEPREGGPPVGGASQTYMRFVPNDELERRREERLEAEERQQQTHIIALASEVRQRWEAAKNSKREIEQEMLRDYRQRNGQYDPDKLTEIRKQGGSEVYMMLTSVKCRSAEAWIRDVMLPADDKAWSCEPTGEPELSPEDEHEIGRQVGRELQMYLSRMGRPADEQMIEQRAEEIREERRKRLEEQAKEIAEKMEDRIEDQFQEGGWRQALDEAIQDVVTTKAGFIAGPIIRRKQRLRWADGPDGPEPSLEEELVNEYERVSPFDIYPAPDAVDVHDSYLFRRHRLSKKDLEAMIGVEGYDENAIRQVLDEYDTKGYHEWIAIDQQRREIEERDQSEYFAQSRKIEAIQYWGPASGKNLEEWGLTVDNPTAQYEIEAWVIGDWVIKAVINDHPLGLRPISKAHYEVIPGAFWGRGVAELMRDTQAMCNASARALANNMGISSGPQVAINDTKRIPAGEEVTSMYPWKIWQFEGDSAAVSSHRPPIEFFQPSPLAESLMKVYDYFSRLSDDYTGIPAYTYGSTESLEGAGDTASGLSMMLNQASKGIRRVISHIDYGLVEPTVRRQYIYNMLYEDDPSIKGDLNVVPKGSQSLVAREQEQVRRTEFLNATANQFDMQILGLSGRAALLRESAKNLNVDVNKVVPDPEELRRQEWAQQQAQQAMMQQGPAGPSGNPGGGQQPQRGQGLNPAGEPAGGQDNDLTRAR